MDIYLNLVRWWKGMWQWTLTEFTFFWSCVGYFVSFTDCSTFHGITFYSGSEEGMKDIPSLLYWCRRRAKDRTFFTIYTGKQMDEREGSNVRNRSNGVSRLWEFLRGFAVLDNKAKGGGITPISVCNSSGNKIPNSHNGASNKVHELKNNEWLISRGVSWELPCQLEALSTWIYPVAT